MQPLEGGRGMTSGILARALALAVACQLLFPVGARAFEPAPVGSEQPEITALDLGRRPAPLNGGADLVRMAVADLNSDGFDDVVGVGAYNLGGSVLSVVLGGRLMRALPLAPLSSAGQEIALADVDLDDKVDVVLADANVTTMLRGRGDGTFDGPQLLRPGLGLVIVRSLAMTDLNGDTRPDLVEFDGSRLLTSVNATSGFAPPIQVDVPGSQSRVMLVNDFDGDGSQDVVIPGYGNSLGSDFTAAWGDGDGAFSTITTGPQSPDVDHGFVDTAQAIDIDRDGDLDVIAAGRVAPGDVAVWRNDGHRGFIPLPPFRVAEDAGYWNTSTLADWDGDGRAEVLMPTTPTDRENPVFVVRCDGRSGFRAIARWDCPTPGHWVGWRSQDSEIASGDFDGDGRDDVAASGDLYTLSFALNRTDVATTAPFATGSAISPPEPDGLNGWYVTPPSIDLLPTRAGALEWAWDGIPAFRRWEGSLTAPEGVHTLSYFAVGDEMEPTQSRTFKVDTTPPVATLIPPKRLIWTPSCTLSVIASGAAEVRARVDGGAWSAWSAVGETLDVRVPWPNGLKHIDAQFRDEAGNSSEASCTALRWVGVGVSRVFGVDRYETAVRASRSRFASATAVVIVNGNSFPDAASAAALAGALRSPVLLTRAADLPEVTRAEIARIGATKAYVIGSDRSVSSAVESSLTALCGQTERISGKDRYATSRAVAEKVGSLTGCKTVFLARGDKFPDALSAAAVAAGTCYPILLTPPTALTTDAASALDGLGVTHAVLVGGTAALSDAVREAVADKGIVTHRLSGSDRYATSVAVADFAVKSGWDEWRHSAIASGESYADGFAAGASLATERGVVLLSARGSLPASTAHVLTKNGLRIEDIAVLGSAAAVSERAFGQIEAAVRFAVPVEPPKRPSAL